MPKNEAVLRKEREQKFEILCDEWETTPYNFPKVEISVSPTQ